MNKSDRLYGFDLLKIICMLFIIGLHFNFRTDSLDSFNAMQSAYYFTWATESLFYVSVNCFVLITGFFNISKTETNIKRLIGLCAAVWFYSLLGLLAAYAFGRGATFTEIATSLTPIISGHYWFIDDYLILCIVSPLLNLALQRLMQRQYKAILLVGLLLFSVVGMIPWADPIFEIRGGTDIVWFVILYAIGGYIKLFNPFSNVKNRVLWAIVFLIIVVNLISKIVFQGIGEAFFQDQDFGGALLYHHNSITILVESISFFCLFARMRLERVGSYIASVSALVFGVYLIHENIFVRETLWKYLQQFLPADGLLWLVFMLTIVAVVFVLSAMLEYLRQRVFEMLGVDEMINSLSNSLKKCIAGRL